METQSLQESSILIHAIFLTQTERTLIEERHRSLILNKMWMEYETLRCVPGMHAMHLMSLSRIHEVAGYFRGTAEPRDRKLQAPNFVGERM